MARMTSTALRPSRPIDQRRPARLDGLHEIGELAAFFNLIANAFEAMAGCGDRPHWGQKTGTSVLIELEDTGPGIPACISDRLFEPLIPSGKKDGLGLGLALARQTVRNHGGDMWTEPAAGARFVIRLPLDRPTDVSEKVSAAPPHTAGEYLANESVLTPENRSTRISSTSLLAEARLEKDATQQYALNIRTQQR